MINPKVRKELIYFIPIFIVIIGISVGLHQISPKLVPGSFGMDGFVSSWIEKQTIHYHIPAVELVIYLIFTYLQFYYDQSKPEIEKYFFNTKYFLIVVVGLTFSITNYFVAVKIISNIWYITGIVTAFSLVYLFITMLTTGFLNSINPPKKTKGSAVFKKKLKNFNRK